MLPEANFFDMQRVGILTTMRETPDAAYPLWQIAGAFGYRETDFDSPKMRYQLGVLRSCLNTGEAIFTVPKQGFVVFSHQSEPGSVIDIQSFRPTPDWTRELSVNVNAVELACFYMRRGQVINETRIALYADTAAYNIFLFLLSMYGRGDISLRTIRSKIPGTDMIVYRAMRKLYNLSDQINDMPFQLITNKDNTIRLELK